MHIQYYSATIRYSNYPHGVITVSGHIVFNFDWDLYTG
jgi:hypothetical protein